MESESGTCTRGGPHHWKWGRCTQCGKAQGDEAKEAARARAKKKIQANADMADAEHTDVAARVLVPTASAKKQCPKCAYQWLDCYGRNECPKCLSNLDGMRHRRSPGESSSFPQPASSAMESESGQCPFGGPHLWKWGRCSLCGKGEGDAAKERLAGGECEGGGRHVFKFGLCVKCQAPENKAIAPGEGAESGRIQRNVARTVEATWKECPTCRFGWHDTYRKNECPKCLNPLWVDAKEKASRQSDGTVPLARGAGLASMAKAAVQIDARAFPGVAHVASQSVPSYLRPKSAYNPSGYKTRRPPSRPATARSLGAKMPEYPGFTEAGRKFAVPVDFWQNRSRGAASPSRSEGWAWNMDDGEDAPTSPIAHPATGSPRARRLLYSSGGVAGSTF